jgi:hypothetical protein
VVSLTFKITASNESNKQFGKSAVVGHPTPDCSFSKSSRTEIRDLILRKHSHGNCVEFIFYCACRNDDKSNITLEKILVITLEVLEGSLGAKDCRVVFCPESSVNYNSQLLDILKHVLVA